MTSDTVAREKPPHRVLGVFIASGGPYLALIEAPDRPLLDDPLKLPPPASFAGIERLREFGKNFAAEVQRLKVDVVVAAEARARQRGWPYLEAREHVSLETTIGLFVTMLTKARFVTMRPSEAAKRLGVEDGKGLHERLRHGLPNKPLYWDKRATAFMVALAFGRS